MTPSASADVVIIGGGITGLWTRAALTHAGRSVVLIDHGSLGDGQTVRSQGILHRGVKYAFSQAARGASEQLSQAAKVWDAALRGDGPIDLRAARVLSDATHLWTVGGVLSNLTAWSASKAMRSDMRELSRAQFPPAFAASPASTRVWKVDEPVLDPGSLLAAVRAAGRGPLLQGAVTELQEEGPRVRVTVRATPPSDDSASMTSVLAAAVILCAGEGNERLLSMAPGGDAGVCQRRPLRMGMVDGAPFELFGHCPQPASDKPRITITTGRRDGSLVWYVGGNVAEKGTSQSPAEFRESLKNELASCVPWADLSHARFDWLDIDRAEGRTQSGARPDGPVLRRFGRVLAAWPTKLALAPRTAELILEELSRGEHGRSHDAENPDVGDAFSAPSIAPAPWLSPPHGWTPLS